MRSRWTLSLPPAIVSLSLSLQLTRVWTLINARSSNAKAAPPLPSPSLSLSSVWRLIRSRVARAKWTAVGQCEGKLDANWEEILVVHQDERSIPFLQGRSHHKSEMCSLSWLSNGRLLLNTSFEVWLATSKKPFIPWPGEKASAMITLRTTISSPLLSAKNKKEIRDSPSRVHWWYSRCWSSPPTCVRVTQVKFALRRHPFSGFVQQHLLVNVRSRLHAFVDSSSWCF